MEEANDDVTAAPVTGSVGSFLKETREKAGKRIEDIAADTRIPLRHLKSIEAGDFNGLPGKTYAMGFVRAYARSLGLDEVEAVARLRTELGADDYRAPHQYEAYEPADPARIPPKTLVLTATLIAALLAGAYGVWKSGFFDRSGDVAVAGTELTADPAETTPATDTAATGATTPAAPAVADNAEVVIAAKDTVWFRIDDATGKRVYEAELKAGDRYTVPAGSKGLTIRTSRPQAMDVSVGGQTIPQLGPADLLVKNVSLDPSELAKRLGSATATPVAGTTPTTGTQSSAAPATPTPTVDAAD